MKSHISNLDTAKLNMIYIIHYFISFGFLSILNSTIEAEHVDTNSVRLEIDGCLLILIEVRTVQCRYNYIITIYSCTETLKS